MAVRRSGAPTAWLLALAAILAVLVALASLGAVRKEPFITDALASSMLVNDEVVWLQVRGGVPRWKHVPFFPNAHRIPLTFRLVADMYAERTPGLPRDADLFFVTTDTLPADFPPTPRPVLTYHQDVRNPDPRCVAIPDCYTVGWPDAKMVSVFDLPASVRDAPPFDRRKDVAFWIGNPDMHETRRQLVQRYRGRPGFEVIPVEWGPYGPGGAHAPRPFMNMRQHCDYKFLIDVQGVGWSARLKHLMLLGSVVLIFDRRLHEYWFHEFTPWVHYVPVAEDGSDLEAALRRLRGDPAEARQIAAACHRKALQVFSKASVYGYYANVVGGRSPPTTPHSTSRRELGDHPLNVRS